MEDNSGNTFTSDWRTRAALDQVSDTLPNEIPVVREQLWRPVRVPDETCWERQPAPMSNWTQVLAMARPYTRIFVMASIYLAVVAAVSLIVARAISTPAKSTSAAETGHQQSRNGLVPYRLTPPRPSAPRKPPAIQPGHSIFPPQPGLAVFTPSPASSQPGSSPPSLSPSPTPTTLPPPTSPPPTSPPPTSPPPTSPPPTSPPPTSPPPTSPPPTSPPPTSPPPTSPPPTSPPPTSPPPTSPISCRLRRQRKRVYGRARERTGPPRPERVKPRHRSRDMLSAEADASLRNSWN